MTGKIFRSILAAVVTVLILSFSVVTGILYHSYEMAGRTQLEDELSLAVCGVELEGKRYLERIESSRYRITWIEKDGTVLYDTRVSAGKMENHGDRKEIQEALENGKGESSRLSDTLTVKMFYYAQRLQDGTVLRIADSMDSVFAIFYDIIVPMIGIFVLSILLSVFLARRMAKGIMGPLNRLDLEHPDENDSYEELSPVLRKINSQNQQIEIQRENLNRKKDEFEQVTSAMKEGLILLDKDGKILSMNPAVRKIYEIKETPVKEDWLTVDRSLPMNRAIKQALKGRYTEFRKEIGGKTYQFSTSPIEFDSGIGGISILCFDVTQQVRAERNRQEFTANVSHELKTPLQSIMGSAELLGSGLVKLEDRERFINHIKKETSRIVALINDIIRLSQLEEKGEIPLESVDLYELAEEILEELKITAEEKNVELDLKGEHYSIKGVRQYLYEIIYNLCDNGIRYNLDGGKLYVKIGKTGTRIKLTVKDTGIGIPIEHQDRVFERFYRVDKSHSKETGGTGLGLSIVKHAVQFHDGVIVLESKPGEGTTVIVLF